MTEGWFMAMWTNDVKKAKRFLVRKIQTWFADIVLRDISVPHRENHGSTVCLPGLL